MRQLERDDRPWLGDRLACDECGADLSHGLSFGFGDGLRDELQLCLACAHERDPEVVAMIMFEHERCARRRRAAATIRRHRVH